MVAMSSCSCPRSLRCFTTNSSVLQAYLACSFQHLPFHLLKPPFVERFLDYLYLRHDIISRLVLLAHLLFLVFRLGLVRVRGQVHLEQGVNGGIVAGVPNKCAT